LAAAVLYDEASTGVLNRTGRRKVGLRQCGGLRGTLAFDRSLTEVAERDQHCAGQHGGNGEGYENPFIGKPEVPNDASHAAEKWKGLLVGLASAAAAIVILYVAGLRVDDWD